jgi:hypothetical protein
LGLLVRLRRARAADRYPVPAQLDRPGPAPRPPAPHRAGRGACAGLVVAVAWFQFGHERLPLLFLAFPVLLLATFRAGLPGATAATVALAAVAFWFTLRGRGPIAAIPGAGVVERAQLCSSTCVGRALGAAGGGRASPSVREARDAAEAGAAGGPSGRAGPRATSGHDEPRDQDAGHRPARHGRPARGRGALGQAAALTSRRSSPRASSCSASSTTSSTSPASRPARSSSRRPTSGSRTCSRTWPRS